MESQPLNNLDGYDCVLIVTDHSSYDYARIVEESHWWSTPECHPRSGVSKKLYAVDASCSFFIPRLVGKRKNWLMCT